MYVSLVHDSVTEETDQGKQILEFIFALGFQGCEILAFVFLFPPSHEVTVSVTFSVDADNTKYLGYFIMLFGLNMRHYLYYLLQLQQVFV